MPIRPLDTLLALKAITFVSGLKDSDKRVGSVLIEHFNRKSGRCDPSLERIAEMTGLSTRTVIRSTKSLVGAGLFKVDRHGGYSNRNSYEPRWHRFEELLRQWDAKLRAKPRRPYQTGLSTAPRQGCHIPQDSAVTQTCLSNLQAKTCSKLPAQERRSIATRSYPDQRALKIPSRDAALVAAERRWSDALHQKFSGTPAIYGDIIERIDDGTRLAASEAELKCRGAGLHCILDRLRLNGERGR